MSKVRPQTQKKPKSGRHKVTVGVITVLPPRVSNTEASRVNSGRIFKTLRRQAGLTQSAVADKLGYSRSYISKVENNRFKGTEALIKDLVKSAGFSESAYESLKQTEAFLSQELPDSSHDQTTATTIAAASSPVLELIDVKTKLKAFFKGSKVETAYLFGSYARGEEEADSDIDVLITFHENSQPTLLDMATYVQELEEILGKKVDIVQMGTTFKHLEESIERDKILVYGKG